MQINFDPRVWNLHAGVLLVVTGCGSRVAGAGGDTSETAEAESTEAETAEAESTAEQTETGPECTNGADCPYGYECFDGVCMYYNPQDGTYWYECYSDYDCGAFEVCDSNICVQTYAPPPDCMDDGLGLPVPVEVNGEALALTFADVDADGQAELVVATETDLLVYEAGGGAPTISSREVGDIAVMVAGSLDAMPGEDLLLAMADSLLLYTSNGNGSFGVAVTQASPVGVLTGLFAGDFDGLAPDDVLGWGELGAFLDRAGEVIMVGESSPYGSAAVHDLDSPASGFALELDDSLYVHDLDAQLLAEPKTFPGGAPMIAALTHGMNAYYAYVAHDDDWSRVFLTRVDSGVAPLWAIPGTPDRLYTGDLDGDGNDEIVFFDLDLVAVEFEPLGENDCWHPLVLPVQALAVDAATGDHDGDGDEELAIRTELGEVVLFDGG